MAVASTGEDLTTAPTGPAVRRSGPLAFDSRDFKDSHARPGLFRYLYETWQRRRFVKFYGQGQLVSQITQDKLGILWLVINPIANAAAYYFAFGVLFGTAGGVPNYTAFLIVGVFLFWIMTAGIFQGAQAINQNKALVSTLNFPRITLVMAMETRIFLQHIPAILTMLVIITAMPPHAVVTWRWALIVPIMAAMYLFCLGMALTLTRAFFNFPDLRNTTGYVIRLLLYCSGIVYDVHRYINHPVVLAIFTHNPIFIFIDLTRSAVIYGQDSGLHEWLWMAGWAVVPMVLGTWLFWRGEPRYRSA